MTETTAPAARVVIVDDVRLHRECLQAQLGQHYSDVRTAWNIPSLVAAIGGVSPPVILLLNIAAQDSRNMLRMSLDLATGPEVIVVGLSADQEWDIVACAEEGASGLHLRTESFDHLLTLMRDVEAGHARCSPEVSAILLGHAYADAAGCLDPPNGPLTVRETEILGLLEDGLTNKQIAARLSVTVHTVKNHVHSLLGKLGVPSRAEAMKLARAMRYAGFNGIHWSPKGPQSPNRSLTSVH